MRKEGKWRKGKMKENEEDVKGRRGRGKENAGK